MIREGSSEKRPSEPRPPLPPDAVPAAAVRRLSLYLRELEGFLKQDRQTTSSRELGEILGYTDAQVRRDLAYFGQFGHPGIGYRVNELVGQIRSILLGRDRNWNALVVGAGNLGQALLTYRGFVNRGFQIVAVFDNDPGKIGQRIGSDLALEVLPMGRLAEVVAQREVQIGIMTVPADAAQEVADALVTAGIKGVLNFAPAVLAVPNSIPVDSVALTMHLEQLAFRINAHRGVAQA